MKKSFILLLSFISILTTSCLTSTQTSSRAKTTSKISRNLYAKGICSQKKLADFFMENNPNADYAQVKRIAKYYITEAAVEGINSDCAFVQMCLETGFLRFGNLVTPEMHNYCGLGSIDAEHKGETFPTEQLGVRAHIQHLHAYATPSNIKLKNECIDRRYKYVNPRGKSPTISGLSGTWAADPNYSIKLENMLLRLETN